MNFDHVLLYNFVLHRNKLVKQNQTCPCIIYNALQVCHYGKFRFILCFQFDGNLSHLIAMASLYFTKPRGEDEAKINNNELGYTFR